LLVLHTNFQTMANPKSPSPRTSKSGSVSDAVFHAKAQAYQKAYYPKELRGKYEVQADYKKRELKFTKQK